MAIVQALRLDFCTTPTEVCLSIPPRYLTMEAEIVFETLRVFKPRVLGSAQNFSHDVI